MSEKGFVTLAFILGIVLLSASVVGGSFYLKKSNPELLEKLTTFTKPGTTPQATNPAEGASESAKKIIQSQTQNNAPVVPPLVAFTQKFWEATVGLMPRQVQIYDLSQKKLVDLDPSLEANDSNVPGIGPLSPDGKYLPIYYISSLKSRPASAEEYPVYFYDLQNNKAIKVMTTTQRLSSIGNSEAFWVNEQSLVYSNFDPARKVDSLMIVNSKGEQSTIPLPSNINQTILPDISRNNRILAKYYHHIQQAASASALPQLISDPPKITVDNSPLPNTNNIKGRVIGILENYLVTLESPIQSNFVYISNENILKNQNQTKGDWLFNFYKLPEGKLEKSITAQDPGWIVRDALIRPNKNTILLQQQRDRVLLTSLSRYTEIDFSHPDQRRIISQEAGSDAINVVQGISSFFEVTADGNWLIGLQPSGSKTSTGADLTQVVAWNIDTKEKVVICKKENINCFDVRVYNPLKMTTVSREEAIAKSIPY